MSRLDPRPPLDFSADFPAAVPFDPRESWFLKFLGKLAGACFAAAMLLSLIVFGLAEDPTPKGEHDGESQIYNQAQTHGAAD